MNRGRVAIVAAWALVPLWLPALLRLASGVDFVEHFAAVATVLAIVWPVAVVFFAWLLGSREQALRDLEAAQRERISTIRGKP